MKTEYKIMNVTRLVAVAVSILYLGCFFIRRGNYLPSRMFMEFGLVWIGMALGYKLSPGRTVKAVMASLSLTLILLWSVRMLVAGTDSLLREISSIWFISPLAFTLFGAAHSGILSEETDEKTALRSALVLSVLFPLVVVSAYIGNGWTARAFLEWERMPAGTFIVIRESSWMISAFLRLVFYVSLVKMFRAEPLQTLSVRRWFKWIAVILIAITGLSYFMRGLLFLHTHPAYSYLYSVLNIPAVWYAVHYLCGWGKRNCDRVKKIWKA